MKKLFITLTLMLTAFATNAFEFDGIDLNTQYSKVAREISARGYAYDANRNCLKGNCQGTEIYLSINYIDVNKRGMVGQLIVEIPMDTSEKAMADVTTLLNVVYHQVAKTAGTITYQVDKDGTQLVVGQKGNSVILTYNTPYYKNRQK